MAYTCPGRHTLPHVPVLAPKGGRGADERDRAQTVIAQIVLPTCSSYDHDTFPGYGVCARGDHDRGPVTRDCLALTTVHHDMPTRMLYFS